MTSLHIVLYILQYCQKSNLDLTRQSTPQNHINRVNKIHDRRNPEGNINYYNRKRTPEMDNTPSRYGKYQAIAQLLNAALTDPVETKMNRHKEVDIKMNEVRDMIKQNEIVTNPNDDGPSLNVIEWLNTPNAEEIALDAELDKEVHELYSQDAAKKQYDQDNKENTIIAGRRHIRDKQNDYVDWARKEFNVHR